MNPSSAEPAALGSQDDPVYVFILSWQRPLYLWACLDALYRGTRRACRFVLADNGSGDPAVAEVIRGFERRGLFEAVHWGTDNDPLRIPKLIDAYAPRLGAYFGYIESDTVVPDVDPCWLERMLDHMRTLPALGMVGSVVDHRDFVDPQRARALRPDLSGDELDFLVKARAPMRSFRSSGESLVEPHNPPGRLLLFRTEAYWQTGFGTDTVMHRAMKQRGWHSKIATDVVHRHLSLLNLFDYPEYGRASRDAFFQALASGCEGPA